MFDLRVLVVACLTDDSLTYRGGGGHSCMHLKVKSRIFNSFPDGQPVKI